MMLLVLEILELLLLCGFSHINHLSFYSLDSCHDWIIVASWRVQVCVLKKKICCRNNLQKNLKNQTWSKSVSVCYLKGPTQIKDAICWSVSIRLAYSPVKLWLSLMLRHKWSSWLAGAHPAPPSAVAGLMRGSETPGKRYSSQHNYLQLTLKYFTYTSWDGSICL